MHGPESFRAVYDRGVRESAGPFVGIAGRTGSGGGMRLGISAPRKVGNAVTRNRVKRQLREAFRTLKHLHTPGVDLVILIRPHKPLPSADVRAKVERLLQKFAARTALTPLPHLNPPTVEPPPPAPQ